MEDTVSHNYQKLKNKKMRELNGGLLITNPMIDYKLMKKNRTLSYDKIIRQIKVTELLCELGKTDSKYVIF